MFGTYTRLRLHVSASDIRVVREARRKLNTKAQRDPKARDARKAFYRQMLAYHHQAQSLFSNARF
jgi:hypothetical protein